MATAGLRIARSRIAGQSLLKALRANPTRDAFYLCDLRITMRQLKRWRALLPQVEPFYALKCNNDPEVARTLAAAGARFDCASRGEIAQVLAAGATPDDIIYANPVKQVSHLAYARDANVRMTVFDSAAELDKIAAHHPNACLLIRLATDDKHSVCRFSEKFGANMAAVPGLIRRAKALGLRIVGVSYHVGSGCYDTETYAESLRRAHDVFNIGASLGMPMRVLDIGGGFPGSLQSSSSGAGALPEAPPGEPTSATVIVHMSSPAPNGERTESTVAVDAHGHTTVSSSSSAPSSGGVSTAVPGKIDSVGVVWSAPSSSSSSASDAEEVKDPPRAAFPEIARTIRRTLEKLFPGCVPAGGRLLKAVLDSPGPGAGPAGPTLVMAEPGRYFVEASHTLFVNVIGRRAPNAEAQIVGEHSEGGAQDPRWRYYINDGLYGSFNNVIYDHASILPAHVPLSELEGPMEKYEREVARGLVDDSLRVRQDLESVDALASVLDHATPVLPLPPGLLPLTDDASSADAAATSVDMTASEMLKAASELLKTAPNKSAIEKALPASFIPRGGPRHFRSSLWGHTCDGFDCVSADVFLPEMALGDWLVFDNAGAYTIAAACPFNGFELPYKVYIPGDSIYDYEGPMYSDEDVDLANVHSRVRSSIERARA